MDTEQIKGEILKFLRNSEVIARFLEKETDINKINKIHEIVSKLQPYEYDWDEHYETIRFKIDLIEAIIEAIEDIEQEYIDGESVLARYDITSTIEELEKELTYLILMKIMSIRWGKEPEL